MCLVEGLNHSTAGVNINSYFTEIEIVVNNGIISEGNGNYKLPVNGDTLYPISLCSMSVRTFGAKIGMLFDIIFRHYLDSNLRMNEFYVCVVTLYQDIMNKVKKRFNISKDEIVTLQKMIDIWYDK